MAKKTVVNLQDLKDALADLNALKKAMEGPGNAWHQLEGIKDSTSAYGDMVEKSGLKIAAFIDARTRAIQSALQLSTTGLDNAVMMLKTTIDTYEKTDTKHAKAANATGNGGGSASGGSGSGGSNGGRGGN